MGLREEILGQDDLPSRAVAVPEWGGREVRVKSMTGAERDAYELDIYAEREAAKKESRKPRNVRARLLVRCLVGEDGKLLFGEADIEALGAKSAAALDRLYDVARTLNGYSEADAKALEKN